MAAPKGFRKVETGMAGFWKPTKAGQFIQGVVGDAIETKGADGKPNTFHTLKVVREDSGPVQSQGGKPVKVYEGMRVGIGGRVLQGVLAEHKGQEMHLVFTGMGKAKSGQSAPKLFDVFVAGHEGDAQ